MFIKEYLLYFRSPFHFILASSSSPSFSFTVRLPPLLPPLSPPPPYHPQTLITMRSQCPFFLLAASIVLLLHRQLKLAAAQFDPSFHARSLAQLQNRNHNDPITPEWRDDSVPAAMHRLKMLEDVHTASRFIGYNASSTPGWVSECERIAKHQDMMRASYPNGIIPLRYASNKF